MSEQGKMKQIHDEVIVLRRNYFFFEHKTPGEGKVK
jgi:hypothetical protein